MNKCACASIFSLRKLKPCTRNDFQLSFLSSRTLPLTRSMVCTDMHTNIRYRLLLLFIVVLYDLKELQIKCSVCHIASVFPVLFFDEGLVQLQTFAA